MQSADRDSKPGVGAKNVGHHYNYEIQAWITYGRVRGCAHPDNAVRPCCNGYRYRGLTESAAVAAFRKVPQSTPSPRPRLDFVNHRGE